MDNFDRLCHLSETEKWDEFIDALDSKTTDKKVIAKLAEILTKPDSNLPLNVHFSILKCLANTCAHFTHGSPEIIHRNREKFMANHCHKLYEELAKHLSVRNEFSTNTFPYNGIAEWAVDNVNNYVNENAEEHIKIIRTCLRFLCNVSSTTDNGYRAFSCYKNLKAAIEKLLQSSDVNILLLTCALIHNILFNVMSDEKIMLDPLTIIEGLIRADTMKVSTANDTIILFLRKVPNLLELIYENLSLENKLYLLEIIYQDLKDIVYKENGDYDSLPENTVIYLMNRFKRRSDLILKTVDTYLDDMEPAEVTILLDILGVLSAADRKDCHILQRDSSLLINAIFLLRALHMAGKEENNYFTPVQKLSELALNATKKTEEKLPDKEDIQNHPAFGFKAVLIRLIGNLVYQHRANQNTVRDAEGISLLLDCCNIDARNPLIIQWCILAIRNLCDGNQRNQEYIGSSQKVKLVDSAILREMGVTLHQDEAGCAIGVVPLENLRENS